MLRVHCRVAELTRSAGAPTGLRALPLSLKPVASNHAPLLSWAACLTSLETCSECSTNVPTCHTRRDWRWWTLTCFSGPQGVGKQSGGASKARGRPVPQPAVGPTLVPRPASSLSPHRDLSSRAQLWTPAPTWGPIPHGAQLQIPAHQEMFESWVQGSALGRLCKLLSSSTCSPMMAGAPCYGLLHPRACVSVVSMWMSRHVGDSEGPIPSGAGVWYVKLACEQRLRRARPRVSHFGWDTSSCTCVCPEPARLGKSRSPGHASLAVL